jgi:hypothetical protein
MIDGPRCGVLDDVALETDGPRSQRSFTGRSQSIAVDCGRGRLVETLIGVVGPRESDAICRSAGSVVVSVFGSCWPSSFPIELLVG